MAVAIHETNRVFGVQTELVKTYVVREEVDERFLSALKGKRQLIVYGSSKQGKSALIRKHLDEESIVTVECSPKSAATDIYRSVLRQSGITIVDSAEKGTSSEIEAKLSLGARIKVLMTGEIGVDGAVSAKDSSTENQVERYVEYNLDVAQDIAELLREFSFTKFILLENFHYLDIEVQKQLAFDLRTFQDYGIMFIVLGIWREANRLVQFNGDLQDRVTEIPVEPWELRYFDEIIKTGESLLNVDFSGIKDVIVSSSYDSVGVFQELCREACHAAGVKQTQDSTVQITMEHFEQAVELKANDYAMRHERNFESFVDIKSKVSSQSGLPSLALPYYFIRILLEEPLDDIETGIHRTDLQELIKRRHHRPDDVRGADMTNFLNGLTQYQIRRSIAPPFVDYDYGSRRVKIIDSTLYFFLRHTDRNRVQEELPVPIEV